MSESNDNHHTHSDEHQHQHCEHALHAHKYLEAPHINEHETARKRLTSEAAKILSSRPDGRGAISKYLAHAAAGVHPRLELHSQEKPLVESPIHANGSKPAGIAQARAEKPPVVALDKVESAPKITPHSAVEPGHKMRSTQLDGARSLAELATAGAIIDKTQTMPNKRPHEVTEKPEANSQADKSPAKITVCMQDLDHPGKAQFLVREDGRIEMHGDPEKMHSENITIELERKPGQLNPTAAETRAANELSDYLAQRLKADHSESTQRRVVLDDKADVISAQVERHQHFAAPQGLRHMTPQTRRSVQDMHRFQGSHGVDMPHAQTDGMGSFHTRGVPRQPAETDNQVGTKEAIAGLWKPDARHPYETARRHPAGGVRVGRYGFSGHQLSGFLKGLGDPPDPAKIDQLIEEGKLPKDFADKLKNPEFAKQFQAFADKLDKGKQPTAEELKTMLPKEAQESMASSMVDQFKQKLGDNPGAIAAGALSGKSPDNYSKADLNSAEGKQLSSAGQRLYDIATSRGDANQQGLIPAASRQPLIETALKMAGVPVTPQNIKDVNTIVRGESSWVADLTNRWDSNWRKGTPSIGLMQTIQPTFNAFAIEGHRDIHNNLDNMVSGIRYAVHQYGSLQGVPGVITVARGWKYRGY